MSETLGEPIPAWNEPKPRPVRRWVDPECELCELWKGQGGPAHDASPNCESGGHEHCTCDTCF